MWNFEFSDFVLLASHEPTLGRQQPIGAEPETLLKRQVRIVLTLTFYAIDMPACLCVCMCVYGCVTSPPPSHAHYVQSALPTLTLCLSLAHLGSNYSTNAQGEEVGGAPYQLKPMTA